MNTQQIDNLKAMGKNKTREREGSVPRPQPQPQSARRSRQVKSLSCTKMGTVVKVIQEKCFGFIKCYDSNEDDKQVFFHFDRVVSGALSLIKGDTIEFSLNKIPGKESDKGPSVFRGTLIKAKNRNSEQLNAFFDKVKSTLEQADKCTSNEEILKILSCSVAWKCTVESLDLDNLTAFLETFLIMKQGLNSLKSHFKSIIDVIARSKLMDMTSSILIPHIGNNVFKFTTTTESFSVLRTFLLTVAAYVPDKARNVVRLVQPFVNNSSISGQLFYDLLETITCSVSSSVGALYWKELPLVPTIEEIEEVKEKEPSDSLQLQPIKQTGPYKDANEYFEILFRLLRADCFQSLKEGINKFLSGTLDKHDLNVYFDVRIFGIDISTKSRVCLAVKLRTQEKNINWDKTKKLMLGNLLCISMNGQFDDVIWTTVASRDLLQSKQVVLVELCSELNSMANVDSIQILISSRSKGMAAESPTYYRAYGPILKALQKQDPENVSFKEELVFVRQTGSPEFLQPSSTVDGRIVLKDNFSNDFPVPVFQIPSHSTIFDDSQIKAVQKCFYQKVAIIQGPPGTGKTFIGVKLVQMLLSLSTKPSGPILVLTYKNHALDEFLKALLDAGIKGVARVGSGSKEGALNEFMLKNLERSTQKKKSLHQLLEVIEDELFEAKYTVEEAFSKLQAAKRFSLDSFISFVSGKQLHTFLAVKRKDNFVLDDMLGRLSYDDLKQKAEKDDSLRKFIAQALELWMPSLQSVSMFEKQLSHSWNWTSHESAFEGNDNDGAGNGSSDDEEDAQDILMNRRSAVDDDRMQFDLKNVLAFDHSDSKDKAFKLFEFAADFLENFPTHVFNNINDLWKVKDLDKVKLLQFIIYNHYEAVGAEFKEKLKAFERICDEKIELRNQHRADILKEKDIVAMTITGASINYELLQEIRPSIVVVEEAAELLEAQLVPALGSWAKQLILIGDHKQLKPSVETYFLERDFNMNLSLMERLIENGFEYSTLLKQNRMRPEFADLLLDIYPNLESNLDRVSHNEPAKCLQSAAFFWHHESQEVFERSGWNKEEADRAINLAIFMIEQGIEPCKITILSAYKGQNSLIRKKLRDEESQGRLKNVQDKENKIVTHTIDNYQGDENDFVIISLVRSNKKKKLGFLKILNRRCVAQSRSRCGLYFLGNSLMFSESPNWAAMLEKMRKNYLVTPSITLVCPKHSQSRKSASSAQELNSQGLCKMLCAATQVCGHLCKKLCQPSHDHNDCEEKCMNLCMGCHTPCKKNCMPTHSHEVCDALITKQLQCSHTVITQCKNERVLCVEVVPFIAKRCGHSITKKCYESEDDIRCEKDCRHVYQQCGHFCKRRCWENCNKDCYECERIKRLEEEKREEEEKKMRKIRENEEKKRIEKLKEQIELEPVREELSREGDTADEYLTVEDQVKKYIQPGHNWYPVVTKIERVTNNRLEMRWRQAKLRMFDHQMRSERKFHGTSKEAVESIIKVGFMMPKKPGMYGTGIYFATDSSKSAQEIYTKGSGMLLLCDVLLGKTKLVETQRPDMTAHKLHAESYDSLFAKRETRDKGGVRYDEYVVYGSDRALPKYIISYMAQNFPSHIALPGPFVAPGKIGKYVLKESRSFDATDPLQIHYRIAESQFLRLMNVSGSKRKIKSITYYSNPSLEKKFEDKMGEFKKNNRGDQCVFGFHGTGSTNVEGIMKNNFSIDLISQNTGNPGQYGSGIYFSEVPKVCFHYGESLLLCKVLLGKCRDVTKVQDVKGKPLTPGYDSHGAYPTSGGNFQIIVIPNKDQILPCYLIENEPTA